MFAVADVWGFDDTAVSVLQNMAAPDNEQQLIHKYAVLLSKHSPLFTNRKCLVSPVQLMRRPINVWSIGPPTIQN